MLESQDRYPLQNIILDDLFSANKTLIALLFLIVMTALGTIWITHQTRILVAENGQLVLEHQALENEYLNLKLEEATQSDNTRIEAIARQLGMKRVEPEQEQEVLILE
ncbi:TPA: cell division protein FtsL [Pasteurella multocida]|nr:cell division protein FtsL [Pasteurella multocida]